MDFNLDVSGSFEMLQTPAPQSTKSTRTRRRVRHQEASSDEESSSAASVVPSVTATLSHRSQRASKTAALTKMTAKESLRINEEDDGEQEDSELTSEDDDDESDQFTK